VKIKIAYCFIFSVRKDLSRTNTLAYYEDSQITEEEKFNNNVCQGQTLKSIMTIRKLRKKVIKLYKTVIYKFSYKAGVFV
jgi:hypothetical protein